MKYHIHTLGCQMNVADSMRLASGLEKLGCIKTDDVDQADIAVLNTCVVRQSAEDRAYGWLNRMGELKRNKKPELTIGLMGCLVGVKGNKKVSNKYKFVDVMLPPSDPTSLLDLVEQQLSARNYFRNKMTLQHDLQDGEIVLPQGDQNRNVISYVPVVYGCSHACTFCIIPFRRGVERSRPVRDIVKECKSLTQQGVKEIVLLGQIVDRYGYDLEGDVKLSTLLKEVHNIPDVERVRFLTSHPNYMDDELLSTVAELPKLCEHIEIPIQSGSDKILADMRRGYTVEQYYELIERVRSYMPSASISCDVIVGFPGETEADFVKTCEVLTDLKFDKVHIAKYSPRPGTVSSRRMIDDVPVKEKERRRRILDEIQAGVVSSINRDYLGQTTEVLIESKHKDKWRGRTRTNKLVFVETDEDMTGKTVRVKVEWTGPWFMLGTAIDNI
ncbi:MAG TPA: tRNA (N6-isopentenyl adenosine(37)-C2)-methylthiotransferase MiaB [Chloroflexi bacterium]|nr:tRNA (N6-isopentenyl adenosine(37)-C2)-methylthiotransferase MiaB [Chloroflexota bacterium]